MADYPSSVKQLIGALQKLPGVGPRSAERIAITLLKSKIEVSSLLESALRQSRERVRSCKHCGFFAEADACDICNDTNRDIHTLCIVEQPTDVIAFEKSGVYKGRYHVLGGTLSPLDGIGPDELSLPQLFSRIRQQEIKEVILGLSSDVRGETTSLYIAQELKRFDIKTTRLATGISVGGDLEFVDSLTLSHALNDRKLV
jgi:recombination protein RecR